MIICRRLDEWLIANALPVNYYVYHLDFDRIFL
jgi:hypothetical protein